MKRKIVALLLMIAVSVSLSSCMLLNRGDVADDGTNNGGTVIQGGENYEHINITTNTGAATLAASKAVLSAVSIRCTFNEYQYTWTGGYAGTKETGSAGSGVIYKLDKTTGDAYIITNYHVVYNANASEENGISQEIYLYLYGMEMMTSEERSYAIPATYIGGSMNYDIAVLKVEDSRVLMESNARAVDIADSDGVTILDTAIAIGNPGAGGLSATVGSINVDSEDITVQFEVGSTAKAVTLRVMRTDAAVNSGNSGGGLFNSNGELIGIVNAKDADESVDNIGYAIPSNVAVAIADNAIYYSDGSIYRCMLGVTVGVKEYRTEYDVETGKIYKLETVVITELTSNAGARGILEVGDIVNSITVDGVRHEVTRIHHVVDSMLYARVGSAVTINVTRDGVATDLTLPITDGMLQNWRLPLT